MTVVCFLILTLCLVVLGMLGGAVQQDGCQRESRGASLHILSVGFSVFPLIENQSPTFHLLGPIVSLSLYNGVGLSFQLSGNGSCGFSN